MLNKLLTVHGIDVWYGELDDDTEQLAFFHMLMSTEERLRADRYTTTALRCRYIATRGLMRLVLSEYCRCAPEALSFAVEAHGKPFLIDYPEVAFNLSHSKQLMALAVGYRCRIGIDIEVMRERAGFEALVQRCFAAEERDYWHALPKAQQAAAFYTLWTQKEAFVKAAGRGLGMGLEHCVTATQGRPRFLTLPAAYGSNDDWQAVILNLGTTAKGALVIGPPNA